MAISLAVASKPYLRSVETALVTDILHNVTYAARIGEGAYKNKQMTNVRNAGNDDAILIIPPIRLTIERGLEIMQDDEYLEITPKSVRLRKKFLKKGDRSRATRKEE